MDRIEFLNCFLYFIRSKADETPDEEAKKEIENDALVMKIVSYILFGVLAISFIVFICLYNEIRLAIAIIKTAAIYIKDTPFVLGIPPLISIITFLWWACWYSFFFTYYC